MQPMIDSSAHVKQPARHVKHTPVAFEAGCCLCGTTSPGNPPMESVFSLPPRRSVPVKKVYLIVNPYGGKGRGKIVLEAALEDFARRTIEVIVLETKHKRHAEEYARSVLFDGFDALCAIGGDGTFNEVVNGLLTRTDRQTIPLGFIAGGTGNSTMVDLKCVDTHACVQAICSGVVRAMDVIEATFENADGSPGTPLSFKGFDSPASRYFINALGFGLGVSATTTAEHLRFLGQMRYDVGAFINILKGFHNRAILQLDGTQIDSDFAIVVVSSGESMTFRFMPTAKVDDGYMDVGLVAHISRARILSLFDQVKKNYRAPLTGPRGRTGGDGGAHVYCPEVQHYLCKELSLTPSALGTYNVDGEILGSGKLRCRVLEEPIEILFQ